MPSAKRSKAAAKKAKTKRSKTKTKRELRGQDVDGVEFVTGRAGIRELSFPGEEQESGSSGSEDVDVDVGASTGAERGGVGESGEETITPGGTDQSPHTTVSNPSSKKHQRPIQIYQTLAPDSPVMEALRNSTSPFLRQMYMRRENARRRLVGEPELHSEIDGARAEIEPSLGRSCAHGWQQFKEMQEDDVVGGEAGVGGGGGGIGRREPWGPSNAGPLTRQVLLSHAMQARGITQRCQDGTCGNDVPPDAGLQRQRDPEFFMPEHEMQSTQYKAPGHESRRHRHGHHDRATVADETGPFAGGVETIEHAVPICPECAPGVSLGRASRQVDWSSPETIAGLANAADEGLIHVPGKACGTRWAAMLRPDCSRFHVYPVDHDFPYDESEVCGYAQKCGNCLRMFNEPDVEQGSTTFPDEDMTSEDEHDSTCGIELWGSVPIGEMPPDVEAWTKLCLYHPENPIMADLLAIPPAFVDHTMPLQDLVNLAERVRSFTVSTETLMGATEELQCPPPSRTERCGIKSSTRLLTIMVAHRRLVVQTDVARAKLGQERMLDANEGFDSDPLGAEQRDLAISCVRTDPSSSDGGLVFIMHRREVPGPIMLFPSNLSQAKAPGIDWTTAAARLPFVERRGNFLCRAFNDRDKSLLARVSFLPTWDRCVDAAYDEDPNTSHFIHDSDAATGPISDCGRHPSVHRTLRRMQSYGHSPASNGTSVASTESGDVEATSPNDLASEGDRSAVAPDRGQFETDTNAPSGVHMVYIDPGRDLGTDVCLSSNSFDPRTVPFGHGYLIHGLRHFRTLPGSQGVLSNLGQQLFGLDSNTWVGNAEESERVELIDDNDATASPGNLMPEASNRPASTGPRSSFDPVRASNLDRVINKKRSKRKTKTALSQPVLELRDSAKKEPSAFMRYKTRQDRSAQLRRLEEGKHELQRVPINDISAEKHNFDVVAELVRLMEGESQLQSLFACNVPLLAPLSVKIRYVSDEIVYASAREHGALRAEGFSIQEIYESRKQEASLREWEQLWQSRMKSRADVWQTLHGTISSVNPAYLGPPTKFVVQMAEALESKSFATFPPNALEMVVNALATEPKLIRSLAHNIRALVSVLDGHFSHSVRVRHGFCTDERDRVRTLRDAQWNAVLGRDIIGATACQIKEGLVLEKMSKNLYMSGNFTAPEDLGQDLSTSAYLKLCAEHELTPDAATSALLGIKDLESYRLLFGRFLENPPAGHGMLAHGISAVEYLPNHPAKLHTFVNVIQLRSEAMEQIQHVEDKNPIALSFESSGEASRPYEEKIHEQNDSSEGTEQSSVADDSLPRADFMVRRKLRRAYAKMLLLDETKFAVFAPTVIMHLLELLLRYCKDVPAILRMILDRELYPEKDEAPTITQSASAHFAATWADGEDMIVVGLVVDELINKVLSMKPALKNRVLGPRFTIRTKRAAPCPACGLEKKGKTCRPCTEQRMQARSTSLEEEESDREQVDTDIPAVTSLEGLARAGITAGQTDPLVIHGELATEPEPEEHAVGGDGTESTSRPNLRDRMCYRTQLTPGIELDAAEDRNTDAWIDGDSHQGGADSSPPTLSATESPRTDRRDGSPSKTPLRSSSRRLRKKSCESHVFLRHEESSEALPASQGGHPTEIPTSDDRRKSLVANRGPHAGVGIGPWQTGSIEITSSKSAESCLTASTEPDYLAPGTPELAFATDEVSTMVAIAGSGNPEDSTMASADDLSKLSPIAQNLGAVTGQKMHGLNLRIEIEATPQLESAPFVRGILNNQVIPVQPANATAAKFSHSSAMQGPRLRPQRSASFSVSFEQASQHSPLVAAHHPELALAAYSETWDYFLAKFQARTAASRAAEAATAQAEDFSEVKEAMEEKASQFKGQKITKSRPPGLPPPVSTRLIPGDPMEQKEDGSRPGLEAITADDPLAEESPTKTRVVSVKIGPEPVFGPTHEEQTEQPTAVQSAWGRIRQDREHLQKERTQEHQVQQQHRQQGPARHAVIGSTSRTGPDNPPGLSSSRRKPSISFKETNEQGGTSPAPNHQHESGSSGGLRGRGRGRGRNKRRGTNERSGSISESLTLPRPPDPPGKHQRGDHSGGSASIGPQISRPQAISRVHWRSDTASPLDSDTAQAGW